MNVKEMKKGYEMMNTLRVFENKIYEVYTQGLMPGLAHLYVGQEAVAVGTCLNMSDTDYITSTHRGHGHLLAKGGDLKKMMAEVLGKKDGYCKGKGGSMHIMSLDAGILGANGIVGGSIPTAVGAGYSIKYRKTDQVVACFFGDGASNQGTFHESLNMASLYELPVVFICENNNYGISVSQKRHQNIDKISVRAKAYGMPGVTIDGNDLEDVYAATKKAFRDARKGKGPTLIECVTYRWGGHHVGDPGSAYRDKDEVKKWKEDCPLKCIRQRLLDKGVKEEELVKIEEKVKSEVQEAVEWAKEAPYPEPEEALQDLYAESGEVI